MPSQSPPLIAVVDDNLYLLETSLNELRVYDINTNIWKKLGVVPVSANTCFGWGVAFKSMGDRLLVVGTSHSGHGKTMVYLCRPSPDVEEQHWEELKHWCDGAELPQFIHNCCEMMSKELVKINRDMLLLREDEAPKDGASLTQSKRSKISIVGIKTNIPDLNVKPCSDSDEEEKGEITKAFQNVAGRKPHDACYVDHKVLYELEVEIIARLPCFEYWKMQFLNKKFLQLLKSCEIFRVRQEKGLVKPHVIMHSGAVSNWEMFDKDFKTFRRLPKVPSSDYCFFFSDKETISVGTQLIVIGSEIEGIVVFRYELENHKWFRGPSMITPRVMYGSASHGNTAFFAGGIQMDDNGNPVVMRTVEKYNSDTKMWTMINGMHKARKFSSGCFLRGKFYVIGGEMRMINTSLVEKVMMRRKILGS
ncbi:hypothetical protein Bca4012_018632 [Brassica carinata]